MIVTVKEASEKMCPQKSYLDGRQNKCDPPSCMAWRWDFRGVSVALPVNPVADIKTLRELVAKLMDDYMSKHGGVKGYCGLADHPAPEYDGPIFVKDEGE